MLFVACGCGGREATTGCSDTDHTAVPPTHPTGIRAESGDGTQKVEHGENGAGDSVTVSTEMLCKCVAKVLIS